MGKIIIPGQEQKPHIYDSVRKAVEKYWSDQNYLQEQYDMFLMAVQEGSSKDYRYDNELAYITAGSPKWDENDTFEEWLKDSLEMLHFRLQELKQRKQNSSQSFPHIITLVREAQDAGEADMAVKGIGEQMSSADYEAFEFIIRKSIEAIQKFRDGKIKLLPPEEMDEEERRKANELQKILKLN